MKKIISEDALQRALSRMSAYSRKPRLGPTDRGWGSARRAIILRREVKTDLALSRKGSNEQGEQIELLEPDQDGRMEAITSVSQYRLK